CALEPVYVDLDGVEDLGGEVTADEQRRLDADRQGDRVEFEAVRAIKRSALRRGWERFREREMRGGSSRARAFAAFREEHRGDLPFMVAEDSADVWGLQHLFRFDATVGVPPDAYSADGQDWGLPVPRWEAMRESGDPWLHARAMRAAELYDAFRVDHVVGIYRTYARPLDKSPPYFIP